MAYVLKLNEPLIEGIRRVGVGQIDKAATELNSPDIASGIHNARKCFKRLRALLDLVRPALDEKTYRRENRRYRDLGHQFSGARDVQVMIETIENLQARHRGMSDNSVIGPLRTWLEAHREQEEEAVVSERVKDAAENLSAARKAFTHLPIKDRGFATIGDGFTATYREGRRRCSKSFKRGNDDTFHDCRKMVQRHWRHLQLVSRAWPDVINPQVNLACEISKIIGEDHDLAVLAAFTENNRAILGDKSAVAEFVDLCRKRQDELRSAAKARCRRLYATPPKALIRTLESFWLSARDIERTRTLIEDAPDYNNVIRIADQNKG